MHTRPAPWHWHINNTRFEGTVLGDDISDAGFCRRYFKIWSATIAVIDKIVSHFDGEFRFYQLRDLCHPIVNTRHLPSPLPSTLHHSSVSARTHAALVHSAMSCPARRASRMSRSMVFCPFGPTATISRSEERR